MSPDLLLPNGSGSRASSAIDATALLAFYASDAEKRAWDLFVAATATTDEETVRSASLQYYRDLLGGLVDPRAVDVALASSSPILLEALIQTVRRRAAEPVQADAAGFKVVAALRRMVAGLLQGRRLASADVDRLRRYLGSLAVLERRARALEIPPAVERAREALASAFAGLSRATLSLLAEPPDTTAALSEIDAAEPLLGNARAFLTSLRGLHAV